MLREASNDRNDLVTILICKNILLREGLKHLLDNTCFSVSDTVRAGSGNLDSGISGVSA